jgi:hypothetical protein
MPRDAAGHERCVAPRASKSHRKHFCSFWEVKHADKMHLFPCMSAEFERISYESYISSKSDLISQIQLKARRHDCSISWSGWQAG